MSPRMKNARFRLFATSLCGTLVLIGPRVVQAQTQPGTYPRTCPGEFYGGYSPICVGRLKPTYFYNSGGCFNSNPFSRSFLAPDPSPNEAYYLSKEYPTAYDWGANRRWMNAEVRVSCWRKVVQGPTGLIYVDYSELERTLGWVEDLGTSGGSGDCDYQIIYDPETCTDDGGGGWGGGGGGGDDGGGGSGGDSGGGDWICDEYLIDPGCYDVYIDGEYDGVVCC